MVATGLFVGTCALLLSTADMGFSRDESFYFRFARSYQAWFSTVDQAETPEAVAEVMGREAVVETWLGNFEHPPLMKSLFGWSWATFGEQRRLIRRVMERDGAVEVAVGGLRRFDAFATGDELIVLRPLPVGGASGWAPLEVGRARVVSRGNGQLKAEVAAEDRAQVLEACPAGRRLAPPDTPVMVGCQVVRDRPLAVLSEATAMRLPGIVAAGLAVMLTFLLGTALFGWMSGLFGGLAFLFIPRHFYHAHLCAFDMPITAAILALLYAYWRAREDRRWALVAGALWGVALLVKNNAFFVPIPLVLHWLWCGRDRLLAPARSGRAGGWIPPIPRALWVMPVVGVAMLFTFWPKLWYDPWQALVDYLSFHLSHDHYMQWYFGQALEVPPFPPAFPFVLTFLTVPAVFLLLLLVGAWLRLRPGRWREYGAGLRARVPASAREQATAFVLFNGLWPIVLIALPTTPIFGGVKHWMPGMPLLMLLAGYGFQRVVADLVARWAPGRARRAAWAVAGALVFAYPVHASVEAAPFGTGHYDAVTAGGVQGAADAQLMRLYWGYTTRQALPWLNTHVKRGGRVFFQNTTRDAYEMYIRIRELRADIRYQPSCAGADVALIEPQKAFAELELEVQAAFGLAGPTWQVRHHGVPMLNVYVRP